MRKLLVPWLFFCLSACYSSSHKTGDVGDPNGEDHAFPDPDAFFDPDAAADLDAPDPDPDRPEELGQDIPYDEWSQDPPPECPPPEAVSTSFTLDVAGDHCGDRAIDTRAVLEYVIVSSPPGLYVLGLRFSLGTEPEQVHDLSLRVEPPVDLELGDGYQVRFRYVDCPSGPVWSGRWFALHDPGGYLVLGGFDGSRARPEGAMWEEDGDFFAPLGIRYVDGLCAPVTDECGELERKAIEVFDDSGSSIVFDRSRNDLDEYRILLENGREYLSVNPTCDIEFMEHYRGIIDISPRWD